MPKKKETPKVEEVIEEVKEAEVPALVVDETGGRKNPEPERVQQIPPNMTVRVRNQGPRFDCDLTAYGYGMRWPTGAVYNIPMSKYMELLKQGMDGVSA